jgi:hypothetical protein
MFVDRHVASGFSRDNVPARSVFNDLAVAIEACVASGT